MAREQQGKNEPMGSPGGEAAMEVLQRRIAEMEGVLQSLRESERQFKAIFESAPDSIFIKDRELRYRQVNAAMERLFGQPASELIGRSDDDLFGAEAGEHIRQVDQRVLAGEAVDEEHTKPVAGRPRTFHVIKVPMFDGQGRVSGLCGIARDVTRRKEVEASLRASEQRFRNLYDFAPIAMMRVDYTTVGQWIESRRREGVEDLGAYLREHPDELKAAWDAQKTVDVNQAALKLLGARSRSQIPESLSQLFTDRTYANLADQILAMAQGQDRVERQSGARTLDGREISYLISTHIPHEGGRLNFGEGIVAIADITELKRAEEAARESSEQLKALYDGIPDGVMVADLSSRRVIRANPAICRLLGYTEAEILARRADDIHPSEVMASLVEDFRLLAGGEKQSASNVPCLRKDGSILHVDFIAAPVNIGGRPCSVCIFRDVSERRAIERERARLESKLRQAQKLEAVGTLAAGVAHDFNNLLLAINGCNELAQKQLPDDHRAMPQLRIIEEACREAGHITQSLLTFARKSPREGVPIELGRLLEETARLLRGLLPESIEITHEIPADEPLWVDADHEQLQHVLLNMAVNARDAMRDGGRLRLALKAAKPAAETAEDSWAILEIEDTGSGMSRDVRSRVFEPFFTTKPRGKGTGLGLAVAHGIITEYDGQIEVYSEPGVGTRFTISLPLRPPGSEVDSDDTSADAILDLAGAIVVVLEEDEIVGEVIGAGLRDSGFETKVVSTGEALMAALGDSSRPAHLVIIDLDLCGGAGVWEAVGQRWPDLPVLLLAAVAGEGPRRVSGRRTRVFSKPFSGTAIAHAAREMLSRVRSGTELAPD